jgi:beta-xylosidase
MLPSALPELPVWSTGRTWAAEVAPTSAGFVMYYSTNAPDVPNPNGDPSQCISAVAADDPAGPFVDESEAPFICQPDLGGSIDATHFVDTDGTPYLIWKNDGNCCGQLTKLWIQEVSEDGLSLVGEPRDLGLRNDRLWEGAVVEAPSILERDGAYYLFYSGGHFSSVGYAVGYATAASVSGPYEDAPDNPILVTTAPAAGPGHQSIVADKDGELWFAYHAWDSDQIGEETGGQRTMWLDELGWENGKPVVRGPDAGPQPRP